MVNISPEDNEMIKKFYDGYHSSKNLAKTYDERADVYDEVCNKLQPLWPEHIAEELAGRYHSKELDTKLVIDMGAGTGLTGEILHDHGFRELHALDMSSGILEEARKKNIYKEFFTFEVSADASPFIKDDTYDAVVSGAAIISNHMKCDVLREFVRITKPNGFVVCTIYDPMMEMNFMEEIGSLMRKRKAELLFMELVPYYLEYQDNYKQVNAYLLTLGVL